MSVEINETNFPGGWFRSNVSSYDLDHDGWLSDEEIAAVTSIDIYGLTVNKGSVKGIEFFTEIVTLRADAADFSGVSFSAFKKLESLEIGSHMERFYDSNEDWDFSECTALKDVKLNSTAIATINFPPSIENIDIEGYSGSSIVLFPVNLTNCPAIKSVRIQGGVSPLRGINNKLYLETVEISSPVYCTGALDFSGDTALKSLDLQCAVNSSTAYPSTLILTGCTALETLNCRDAAKFIGTLDLSTCVSLQSVDCRDTRFTEVILGENQNLSKLLIYGTTATPAVNSIDITDCPKLVNLFENYTPAPQQNSNDHGTFVYYTHGSKSSANAFSYDRRTNIVSAGIVVNAQPESVSVEEGEPYSFTFDVTGSNISYVWQKRVNKDSPWVNLDNNNATYSGIAVAADSGSEFQCIVTNNIGTVISNIVKLTILFPPAFLSFPEDITITENNVVTFSAPATGNDIVYKWQFSNDNGTTWVDIRNSNNSSYELLATLSISGFKYRCIAANSIGEVISDPATLTVAADTSVGAPVIDTQPSSTTVAEGSSVTFAVSATGNDISYQWQVFKNNQWTNIQNATSASYTTVGTRSANGNQYRCVISNAAGAIYSDPATLTVTMGVYVSTPRILTQPRSVNVDLGELVTFWIRADGGDLSYQWQKLNNGIWYDITGATSASYVVMARTEVHNTQYRCIVTNTAGSVTSSTATLSIRAGHDLSFYGYHSIIISGKNTYGEWEMYPTSRPHVAPPEVKTSYVDLPGADGGLDYTDLLTGEPRYGYRKGSWEFLLIPQDRWAAVYRSLVTFLHGKQHTVILEDDPNYVYTGRLSVNEWQSAAHNSLITIDYILEPFPRNISGQEEDEEENQILSLASTLLNKEKYAGMVIGKINGAATLIYPDMLFDDGDNIAY